MLPTEKDLNVENVDYKLYRPISFKKKVNNLELIFSGYIFHQRERIQPAELQGVLIRIKDVAIGNYDRTFLHYPKAEGPMLANLPEKFLLRKDLKKH